MRERERLSHVFNMLPWCCTYSLKTILVALDYINTLTHPILVPWICLSIS